MKAHISVTQFVWNIFQRSIKKFEINDYPHFRTHEEKELFSNLLSDAEQLVEYGSGGSTIYAAARVKRLVSVESDKKFFCAVRRKLSLVRSDNSIKLLYRPFGICGRYSMPLKLFGKTFTSKAKILSYVKDPWGEVDEKLSTVVLIDGRFRISCLIEAAIQSEKLEKCTILLDDYLNRNEYSIVQEIFPSLVLVGNLAVIKVRSDALPNLDKALQDKYLDDPR